MTFVYLLDGILIGFLLAAPIGPAGIICIRRTLVYGKSEGLKVALGGAAADIVYAIVAAFGLTLISDFVSSQQKLIRIVGGILLMVVGMYSYREKPLENRSSNKLNRHAVLWAIFFMGLANPMLLFAYAATFSSYGLDKAGGGYMGLALLAGGVFLGSFLWFWLLTLLSHFFKERATAGGLAIVDKISGSLLVILGGLALWRGLG